MRDVIYRGLKILRKYMNEMKNKKKIIKNHHA